MEHAGLTRIAKRYFTRDPPPFDRHKDGASNMKGVILKLKILADAH